MKKKKLKLDLKKITIARLNDESAQKIKGGGYTTGCGQTWSCGDPILTAYGSTCVFGYVNGIYECLRDS